MYQVFNGCAGSPSGPSLFRDAFLFGEEGIPLQGNRIINRFVNYPNDQILIWLMQHQNRKLVSLDGVVLPLYGDWSYNFWHWCTEMLPVAYAAHEAGFSGTYLVPQPPFAAESLQLLGIRADRIRVAEALDYHLECMYLLRKTTGHDPATMEIRGRIREALRAHFARTEPRRHLYITRNSHPDTMRKVVNEEALLALLQRFDFLTLRMEELSLSDQLAHTCNAATLLGPHGAGITHCAFMPERSMVIELFPPTYITPCNILPCHRLRHRYFQLTSSCHYKGYQHGYDIEVNLPMLEMILEKELSGY
ncbi:glycosyltransferase family 61 protein [Geomonas subterranea]|uniref:Glycosyltransferase family 61 protein n=1 Tax=Geomonas subterranea TaxID=2847989 RepID=A0ABX8LF87_9BACT|nr:glycosyltransferase family 61 protein [Geomonas subterranea]QXE90373.1 glycosyltransferase family 61 protein [Geomonas subterranea]QXM07499.1 glycosyltransferase family 61 protein [Geomonas subterranea]